MMNETGRNRRVLRCPECVVADQIAPDVDLRRDLRIGFVAAESDELLISGRGGSRYALTVVRLPLNGVAVRINP